jgi:PAS domain S-box-containing protein
MAHGAEVVMDDRGGFISPGDSAAFLAAIVESAEDAILALNLDGTILYWNAAAERMYGYGAEEAVGKSISMLVPPDREDEVARILETVAGGERLERFETIRHTKDGRAIDVSLTASPIRSADGRVVGASTIARDIGERARFVSESQRAERLEVASRLARGIARELVDLVTAIQGHASLVLEDLAEDPRTGRSAEAVRQATQRAAEVAHQLLALSGDQVMTPRPIDLNQAIASSIRLLGEVAGRSTTVELELDPLIPDVEVDPDQLDHVLVGLVAASKDRMRAGGTIMITTRPGTSGSGAPDVVLLVHDDGGAIAPEELDQIFEPFHTRGASGDGNLWLATAHGILTQSGGSIRASSGDDGTTFTVRLPTVTEAPATVAPRTVEPLPHGSEWVLVVDDEDGVRDFIERALTRLGYHVTSVSSGEEALERVRGYFAEPIDLLITDVVLPGMSGPELAAALGASRPAMPILYVSGYASDVTAFHGLPGLAANVLAKPFGMDTLVRRVRTILDERAPRTDVPAPSPGIKWEMEAQPQAKREGQPGV